MESIPDEILLHIFSYLYQEETTVSSVNDLLKCELVCKKWMDVMKYSLWKQLCQNLLKYHLTLSKGYSELNPTFAQHYSEYEDNHKVFYLKLLKLNARWDISSTNKCPEFCFPKVTTIDTTILPPETDEDNGSTAKKSKISDQWRQIHDYSGIYDMVYVKEKSWLVASINGMIQVWDIAGINNGTKYECLNVIKGIVLDYEEKEDIIDMVTCFYVTETGNSLICGTNDSKLKVFDMRTPGGRLVEKHFVNGQPLHHSIRNGNMKKGLSVCDVRIRQNALIAIDWYGGIHEWKIDCKSKYIQPSEHPEQLLHLRSFYPNFGPLRDEWEDVMKSWWHSMQYTYNKRFCERLLDFSDEVILLTKDKLMCILPRNSSLSDKNSIWIETNHSILCCKILPMPKKDKSKKGCENQIVILCGQQQGILLRYAFNPEQFSGDTSSGFTYIKPQNPYILSRAGQGKCYLSARQSILYTDFLTTSNGPLTSLHVFCTYFKGAITSITSSFLPTLKKERKDFQNCLIIIGDKDGELYFLDGLTLNTKFHIGIPHTNFTDYSEITEDNSLASRPLHRQGVTYSIRGRLQDSAEEESIIWAVQSDCSRIFSGDSNGKLVIHDFWKYDEEPQENYTDEKDNTS